MNASWPPPSWPKKFANAFRGIALAIHGQSSFYIHLLMTLAVIGLAAFFSISRSEWCQLILCVTIVMAAETFNTALEWMAKTIDREHNPQLGGALDIASGAVLISAIGASMVGLLILGTHAVAWWFVVLP